MFHVIFGPQRRIYSPKNKQKMLISEAAGNLQRLPNGIFKRSCSFRKLLSITHLVMFSLEVFCGFWLTVVGKFLVTEVEGTCNFLPALAALELEYGRPRSGAVLALKTVLPLVLELVTRKSLLLVFWNSMLSVTRKFLMSSVSASLTAAGTSSMGFKTSIILILSLSWMVLNSRLTWTAPSPWTHCSDRVLSSFN